MSKLSERALLVSVHRTGWAGTKVDQEVSEEARQRHNAKKGAGRFTKVLAHPQFFGCVTAPLSQADAVWKRLSLPWGSNGDRIMSTMAYPQFCQEIHAARLAVDIGKHELKRKESDIHAEARERLQGMYNRKEYPSIDEIVGHFAIDVEVKPIPEGGDFRTKLSDATVKAMVKDLEARNKERLDKANKEVFRRVADVVERLTTTLKEYQPKTDTSKGRNFKNSLVENVRDAAELIPALNLTSDQRLDSLQIELLDDLTTVPPEILKNSAAARESAISKADKLLAKIQGFMA